MTFVREWQKNTQKRLSCKIMIRSRSRFATLLQRSDTQSLTDCEAVYHDFARGSLFATLLQRSDTQSLTDCEAVYHHFARGSLFATLLQRSDTQSAYYRSHFATLLQRSDTQSLRETARLCIITLQESLSLPLSYKGLIRSVCHNAQKNSDVYCVSEETAYHKETVYHRSLFATLLHRSDTQCLS